MAYRMPQKPSRSRRGLLVFVVSTPSRTVNYWAKVNDKLYDLREVAGPGRLNKVFKASVACRNLGIRTQFRGKGALGGFRNGRHWQKRGKSFCCHGKANSSWVNLRHLTQSQDLPVRRYRPKPWHFLPCRVPDWDAGVSSRWGSGPQLLSGGDDRLGPLDCVLDGVQDGSDGPLLRPAP